MGGCAGCSPSPPSPRQTPAVPCPRPLWGLDAVSLAHGRLGHHCRSKRQTGVGAIFTGSDGATSARDAGRASANGAVAGPAPTFRNR